jgi:putative addiction module component (TIGR02574 family)
MVEEPGETVHDAGFRLSARVRAGVLADRPLTIMRPAEYTTRVCRCRVTGRTGPAGYIFAMPHSLPPPPGFDALPVEDQIDYVQSLWNRIAAAADNVPLHEWQQDLLEERLAAHRGASAEARPWKEVIERVEQRLRTSL